MKRCRSNVLNNGLTPGQERAIQAMLTARSIAAAARQADVGQSTLRRWLREDDNFQEQLRQFRDEALLHAALMLQVGAAQAVCLMYELIQSGRPVDCGKVTLIRAAIEYAFRSAVYCDIIDRVRVLEKAQRQNQPEANNPTPAAVPNGSKNRTADPDREAATDSKQATSQDLRSRRNFLRSAHPCSNPPIKKRRNFRGSAHNCLPRTPWDQSIAVQAARKDAADRLFRPFSPLGMRPTSRAKAAARWRSLIE